MHNLYVVYGGQWGSEGKGQIAAFLAENEPLPVGVRVGGPNAGHTFVSPAGEQIKAQSLPVTAWFGQMSVIGASGYVHLPLLEKECGSLPEGASVIVDEQAVIITDEYMAKEAELRKRIASTAEGVGEATAEKARRRAITFYQDNGPRKRMPNISSRVLCLDTVRFLNRAIDETWNAEHTVIAEGTQGYLLSLNTSGYYPYCTSRECGPDALMSQIGVSIRSFEPSKRHIVCVMRTYPIRVGGPSGPLPNETDWETLRKRTKGYVNTPERTTVTKTIRRIAEWDWNIAHRTVQETRPNELAITFLDYLFPEVAHATEPAHLTEEAWTWLAEVEDRLGVRVKFVSCGPGQEYTFRVAL